MIKHLMIRATALARTLACVIAAILFTQTTCSAQDKMDAAKALNALPKNTWYDEESKSFSPPKFSEDLDNPLRKDGWKYPQRVKEDSWEWPDWDFSLPSYISDWFSTIVLTLLGIALILAIAALTWFAFRDYIPNIRSGASASKSIKIDPTRVVDLPFEVHTLMDNPLEEAKRMMKLGSYDQAIIFLYGYMLLALDQQRRLHLQKGKTNRMYLREIKYSARLREIVEKAMLGFEDSFFGKHPIGETRFMESWGELDEFHHLATRDPNFEKTGANAEVAPA